MPKPFIVKINVPSGSRPDAFLSWLNRLLKDHRMEAVEVTEGPVDVPHPLPPDMPRRRDR